MNHFNQFKALSSLEKKLFFRAWWWCLSAKLIILMIPFHRFKCLLGVQMVPHGEHLTKEQQCLAIQIKQAVSRASRACPFHCQCLVLAITAQRLLRQHQIPSTLYLGVAKERENLLKAHAWVRSGMTMITGGVGHEAFTILVTFGFLDDV